MTTTLTAPHPGTTADPGGNWLIAPAVIAYPTVVLGVDREPTLLPGNALADSVPLWAGLPVHLNHAQPDRVYHVPSIGAVVRARLTPNGRLAASLWLNMAAIRTADERLHDDIKRKVRIELSARLLPKSLPAAPGLTAYGKACSRLIHTVVPRYVALLTDHVGHCTVANGAGLFAPEALTLNWEN